MKFKIEGCHDGWISISYKNYRHSMEGMLYLFLTYQREIKGKYIYSYQTRRALTLLDDPYRLRFFWNREWGCVIFLDKKEDLEEVLSLINRLFLRCRER